MSSPIFGEATVQITADLDDFVRLLRSGLNDAASEADRASNRLGDGAGNSFNTSFIGRIGSLSASLVGTLAKSTAAIGALGAAGGALSGLAATVNSLGGLFALLPAGIVATTAAVATLKLGTQGFADAVAATDATKFNELAETLSPSARAAAVSVRSLAGAFEEMQNSIQEELFSGTASVITDLGNTFIPVLRTQLSGIASDFNEAAVQTGNFLSQGTQVQTVQDILANSRTAVGNLSTSMSALVQIFLDVAAVGSEFLPGLTDGFDGAAQRAADFVSAARETGELEAFIQGALDTLSQLGDVFQNIGRIVKTVFGAFESAGGGALGTLVALTDQIADFLESATGQDVLRTLAQALQTIAQVAGTVLQAALDAVGPALVQLLPVFAQLAELAGGVVAQAITLLVPIIVQLVQAIAPLIPPVLQLISQLLPPMAEIITALVPIVAAFISILVAVLPPITTIVTNINNFLIPAVQLIATVVTTVANIVASVFGFIANLLASIHTGITNTITGAWTAVGNIISGAVNGIRNFVSSGFNFVVSTVSNALSSARNAVSSGISGVLSFFRDLPGNIVSALSGLASRLFSVGGDMIQGLLNGLRAAAGRVIDFFTGLIRRAISSVTDLLGISSPSRVMRGIGRDTGEGLIQGLSDMIAPTSDASQMLAAAAVGAVGSVTGQFSRFAGSASLGGLTGNGAGGVGAPAAASMSPNFTVDVRIGDTPVNDMMDVRIREREREIRRRTPLRGRL